MKRKAPTPVESEEEEMDKASSYDDESDLEEKDFVEKDIKKGKVQYKAKAPAEDAKSMIKQQNKKVVATKKETVVSDQDAKPQKGMRLQKVLGKKKTVKDTKGDEWEVVDKRATVVIQKALNTDTDSGSELSYD